MATFFCKRVSTPPHRAEQEEQSRADEGRKEGRNTRAGRADGTFGEINSEKKKADGRRSRRQRAEQMIASAEWF